MTLRQKRDERVLVCVRTFERLADSHLDRLLQQFVIAEIWSDAMSAEFCYEQFRTQFYGCFMTVLSEHIIDEYITEHEAFNRAVLRIAEREQLDAYGLRDLELQLSLYTAGLLRWLGAKCAQLTKLDEQLVLLEHDYIPSTSVEPTLVGG